MSSEISSYSSSRSSSYSDDRSSYSSRTSSRSSSKVPSFNDRTLKSERHDDYYQRESMENYRDRSLFSFRAMVTPLSELRSGNQKASGGVQFMMRRKNKTVTLQWEPFKGKIAANGISYLTVVQSICNVPPYTITDYLYIKYKGIGRQTRIEIDPHDKETIKFYLNPDSSTEGIAVDDSVEIMGGSTKWIVE